MIYIHVPFCHRKCSYCAFYSVATPSLVEGYVDALLREMSQRRAEVQAAPQTLYIGGGTPSLLPVRQLARIAEALAATFDLTRLREATIECNPEDLSPAFIADLRSIGLFDRLSVGVQSFDDGLLQLVGRRHTAREAVEAVSRASAAGFERISIDLIYGLPGLDSGLWRQTVEQALALPVDHLSAYALSLEPGTLMQRRVAEGRLALPDEATVIAQYHELCSQSSRVGFEHYEVSSYSLPGHRSLHNSRYWDRTPYLGLGPAAHSFDGHRRRWNEADIRAYIMETTPPHGDEVLSERDARNELIMTALRTADGLRQDVVSRRAMQSYIDRGWIVADDEAYRPTEVGLLYADGMAAELFE